MFKARQKNRVGYPAVNDENLLLQAEKAVKEKFDGLDPSTLDDLFVDEFHRVVKLKYRLTDYDLRETLWEAVVLVADHILAHKRDFRVRLHNEALNVMVERDRGRKMAGEEL